MAEIISSFEREEGISLLREDGITIEEIESAKRSFAKILNASESQSLNDLVFTVSNVTVSGVKLREYEFRVLSRGVNENGDVVLFDGAGNYLNATQYFEFGMSIAREALS